MNKISILYILTILAYSLCATDYYKVLDIPRNANQKQIKKGFRKQSMKFHPDRNQDRPKWAKKKFTEIAAAYETLKDEGKRRAYDMGGEDAVQDHEQRQNEGEQQRAGGQHRNMNMDDMFGNMFGEGGFGGGGGFNFEHNSFGGGNRKPRSYFKDSEVRMMKSEDDFDEFNKRRVSYAILFYESNQLDQDLEDTWKELAQKLGSMIIVGAINCEKSDAFCRGQKVRQIPQIKVYTSNNNDKAKSVNPYQNLKRMLVEVTRYMENNVVSVHAENWQSLKSLAVKEQKHIFLIITNRSTTSPLIKSLSTTFGDKVIIGEIKSYDNLASQLKFDRIPSFVWVKDIENETFETFEGQNTKYDMSLFIRQRGNRKFKTPSKKLEPLSFTTLQNRCGRKESNFCLVAFYSNSAEYNLLRSSIDKLLPKYREDKIIFFAADTSILSRKCLFGREKAGSAVYLLRSKRRKFKQLGDGISSDQMITAIDSALGGAMIKEKMVNDVEGCLSGQSVKQLIQGETLKLQT